MDQKKLSGREEQILNLSIQGMTNEGIANSLALSIGTVNTYWLRMRTKVGASCKTEVVARIITERAQKALRESNVERSDLHTLLEAQSTDLQAFGAARALLSLVMDQINSVMWATDDSLKIQVLANGKVPKVHSGVVWEAGKSVHDIFKTSDPNHPAIAAHLQALKGDDCFQKLTGEFAACTIRVRPLRDERDKSKVLGCMTMLNWFGAGESALGEAQLKLHELTSNNIHAPMWQSREAG